MDKIPPKEKRKIPRKISKTYLENAALFYLQRYATSSANLKRILARKIDRSCRHHQDNPEDFLPLVDELLLRYQGSGLLNDSLYAQNRVMSLRRQGLSKQAIFAKLNAKGLSKTHIETALAEIDDEHQNPELHAALQYARRKKLGVFRIKPPKNEKTPQNELASMGRAGFSYDIAKRALKGEDIDSV